MEELVRRLIHEKRTKTDRRPKPSEAFARHFGENHGVELPLTRKTVAKNEGQARGASAIVSCSPPSRTCSKVRRNCSAVYTFMAPGAGTGTGGTLSSPIEIYRVAMCVVRTVACTIASNLLEREHLQLSCGAASRFSSVCLRSTPQRYPEREPSLRTTRWQGTATARGLAAHAPATARAAPVAPMRFAIWP